MKICKVEWCNEKHGAKGYCDRHYSQMRKYGKILKRTIRDPNQIIIRGEVAEIVLYNKNGNECNRAIIDTQGVEKIKHFKWHETGQGRVATRINDKMVLLQHIIIGLKQNKATQVDHIDRNVLNNRKANLRICTHTQNARNAGIGKNNTSGYKGVCWNKRKSKWMVEIMADRKRFFLGYFKNKLDAAKAYNAGAIKYHGKFACLNRI